MLKKIFGLVKGRSDDSSSILGGNAAKQNMIAACVLLLEAAHIDNDCSVQEMEHIVKTLQEKFNISQEYVSELLELAASEKELAVDLWDFTNHINQHFSKEEKMSIMQDVWRLVLLDDYLERHEDHFAHKLGNLLRLSHKELIEAKGAARSQLS